MANVLLIEADRPLAASLTDFLQSTGHSVDWYVDAQTAMDSADEHRPDIIVLDFMLAGRSGLEFLYEFRTYSDWQKLPVIVFSHIAPADLGSAMTNFKQLGISAYHYKPATSLAVLAESIEHNLRPVAA